MLEGPTLFQSSTFPYPRNSLSCLKIVDLSLACPMSKINSSFYISALLSYNSNWVLSHDIYTAKAIRI